MKTILLTFLTLTIAFEVSAQRRSGPSSGRGQGRVAPGPGRVAPGPGRVAPGPGRVAPGPGRVAPGPGRVAPGPGRVTPGPGRVAPGPGRVVVRPVGPRYNPPQYRRPVIYRTGPVIRVQPRYVYNSYSSRYLRSVARAPIRWTQPFGYTCNQYEQLMINGSFIHNFNYLGECSQAIQDIRVYGDFCDGEDLYDQSGVLEAQFTFDYECRNALGYYY